MLGKNITSLAKIIDAWYNNVLKIVQTSKLLRSVWCCCAKIFANQQWTAKILPPPSCHLIFEYSMCVIWNLVVLSMDVKSVVWRCSSPSEVAQSPEDIPAIDPRVVYDLELHARKVADNLDTMMQTLSSKLYKVFHWCICSSNRRETSLLFQRLWWCCTLIQFCCTTVC